MRAIDRPTMYLHGVEDPPRHAHTVEVIWKISQRGNRTTDYYVQACFNSSLAQGPFPWLAKVGVLG